jgi:hypothetical protein
MLAEKEKGGVDRMGAPKYAAIVALFASLALSQSQPQDQPTVKETLSWIQTSLESGSGDYSVGHEMRSLRLEDFAGCKAHFSYSEHQEPYVNGEPAPEPNRKYHLDYYLSLTDVDPSTIVFTHGPPHRIDAPSLVTIRTRNDQKKITIKFPWDSEPDSKPTETYLILTMNSFDSDYVVRFAKALKHAVKACGGKPSLF